jgi:outer membrane lipoprotein-sorting protein
MTRRISLFILSGVLLCAALLFLSGCGNSKKSETPTASQVQSNYQNVKKAQQAHTQRYGTKTAPYYPNPAR